MGVTITHVGQQASVRAGGERRAAPRAPVGGPQPGRARQVQPRPVRSAHLLVRRVEPLSVLRVAFVVAVGFVIAVLVLVAALYALLDVMGVFDTVGGFSKDVGATRTSAVVSLATVLRWTALGAAAVALVGVAAATVAAYVYNLVSRVVGGPEVTLTERRR
jgi:Transmembrane domain of unknown function (DUF3566)